MAGSKAVQVLEVLKKISDESHGVTQAGLLEAMRETGDAATDLPDFPSKRLPSQICAISMISRTRRWIR